MIKISPSILSADFANLERDIKKIEKANVPYVHIDVMDGHFVPNITFGPSMVASLRRVTDMTLDVHLMIEKPQKYAEEFLKAGADILTVHYEAHPDFDAIYDLTQKYGRKLAMAINPPTSADVLKPYADRLDMMLVMSVNPGFGAQAFIESSVDKIKSLRALNPDIDIEVDGGIKLNNVEKVLDAGANVIVAGSAIFGAQDVTAAARRFVEECGK